MYSTRFSDIYFSAAGGLAEKRYVFVDGCKCRERWSEQRVFTVGELGFGTGRSFLATLDEWKLDYKAGKQLQYFGIEAFPISPPIMRESLSALEAESLSAQSFMSAYAAAEIVDDVKKISFDEYGVSLSILVMDVRVALQRLLASQIKINAWYLDGFSPTKNPEMWSAEVLSLCGKLASANATVASYSVSRSVCDSLAIAGFHIKKIKGFAGKRHSLIGHLNT